MIAAATQATHSMSLDHLPFGWFDVTLLALLGFGLFRGRKNGMTKEVLPMLLWLSIVVVSGLGYEPVGQVYMNTAKLDKTLSYVLGYFSLAFVIYLLYVLVKKPLMPRLTGSNFFGSGEYYFGMLSGMIRYTCILIFALALLNAPFYTAADIANTKAYNARWFGGGLQGYSGDFFPTLQTVQEGVFKTSFTGPYIKDAIGVLLINSVPPGTGQQPAKKIPIIHIGN